MLGTHEYSLGNIRNAHGAHCRQVFRLPCVGRVTVLPLLLCVLIAQADDIPAVGTEAFEFRYDTYLPIGRSGFHRQPGPALKIQIKGSAAAIRRIAGRASCRAGG